jgi:hypothetical protein
MLSEINRLREAGFIKEIHTEATWVANPVLVPAVRVFNPGFPTATNKAGLKAKSFVAAKMKTGRGG